MSVRSRCRRSGVDCRCLAEGRCSSARKPALHSQSSASLWQGGSWCSSLAATREKAEWTGILCRPMICTGRAQGAAGGGEPVQTIGP